LFLTVRRTCLLETLFFNQTLDTLPAKPATIALCKIGRYIGDFLVAIEIEVLVHAARLENQKFIFFMAPGCNDPVPPLGFDGFDRDLPSEPFPSSCHVPDSGVWSVHFADSLNTCIQFSATKFRPDVTYYQERGGYDDCFHDLLLVTSLIIKACAAMG